jgi:hypothetical protein
MPVVQMPDMGRGRCAGVDADTFRRAQLEDRRTLTAKAVERAKTICAQCPLAESCRAYVLGQESPAGSWAGVWGGLDAEQRKVIERAQH